jgi:hypothetical protein
MNIDGDQFETLDTGTTESEASARYLQVNNEGEAPDNKDNVVKTDGRLLLDYFEFGYPQIILIFGNGVQIVLDPVKY